MRLFAILHLCIVFSVIFWYGGKPFMGEIYEVKSKKLVYESVMDHELFDGNQSILKDYAKLNERLNKSFFDKLGDSIKILFVDLGLFDRVWILLSLVIPIFLLLRIEGAVAAVWLLPIAVLCMECREWGLSEEKKLFPSEEQIVKEDISGKSLHEQKEILNKGWQHYLNSKWGGEYGFLLARIEAIKIDEKRDVSYGKPLFLLGIYFTWNLIFAISIFLSDRRIAQKDVQLQESS